MKTLRKDPIPFEECDSFEEALAFINDLYEAVRNLQAEVTALKTPVVAKKAKKVKKAKKGGSK